MLLTPRTTEKAYNAQSARTYIFTVPLGASKQSIAAAVAEEHGVTVTDVRTLVRKGKSVRYRRGRRAYATAFRQDKKLAYVTLKDGDSIKVFEDSAEDSAPETSSSKKSKDTAEKSAPKKSDKKTEDASEKTTKSNKEGAK